MAFGRATAVAAMGPATIMIMAEKHKKKHKHAIARSHRRSSPLVTYPVCPALSIQPMHRSTQFTTGPTDTMLRLSSIGGRVAMRAGAAARLQQGKCLCLSNRHHTKERARALFQIAAGLVCCFCGAGWHKLSF